MMKHVARGMVWLLVLGVHTLMLAPWLMFVPALAPQAGNHGGEGA
jgi:hypothetical protein